ncbi:sensor histidine kinase [Culicoidibacter larvae]|uniref:histidine kinase n=1 Tax=Culicoidibacter larvae TaxID=2579976 RepID=A0A5R8Q7E9_9FIRM|nr:HAMP domain-containing sensor histidine kinase [Culicoidibacter larvae]TLG70275.1 HAMP domain-containing histidine kinase [Culicoidibacter larvae]
MSGSSKQTQFRWRNLIYIIGALYIVVVAILVFAIYQIPYFYDELNRAQVDEIVSEVQSSLTSADADSRITALEQVVAAHSMDVVVLAPTNTFFATKPETNFAYLREMAETDMLSYQGAFTVTADNTEYQVWLAIYKVTPQTFFVIIMSLIGAAIILLCGLMAALIFLMFRKLIQPLRRLRSNIMSLREYRLAQIQAGEARNEYDVLSRELGAFSGDLQVKIDSINKQYTKLERNLEAQREKSVVKTRLVNALVHDLKTPLNVNMLQTDLLKQHANADDEQMEIIAELTLSNNRLRDDVNQILQVINNDNVDSLLVHERIDIVAIVKDTLRLFEPLLRERGIAYYLDAPGEVFMVISDIEFRQIIHNLISNATQYGDRNGVFELTIDESDAEIIIEAYNDKADASEIDFDRAFDLFYRVDTKDTQNEFGSGIGLYTVQAMVEAYQGRVSFAAQDEGVVLKVWLPKQVGGTDA